MKRYLTRFFQRRWLRARHLRIGATGEAIVANRFSKFGSAIVFKNWRCAIGELDLIVVEDYILKIIEVKTRLQRPGKRGFSPFMNITPHKIKKLKRLTDEFCDSYRVKLERLKISRIEIWGIAVTIEPSWWRGLINRPKFKIEETRLL
jgi:putative endonuclease